VVFERPGSQASVPRVPVTLTKPQQHPQDITVSDRGIDRYVDDRGSPRLGNEYPHIHRGYDSSPDTYFVQVSRGPRDHPTQERVEIYGQVADKGLVDAAVSILGAILRGEELR
jgi:hypothetical protein